MSIRDSIRRNRADVASFGPGFLLRHLGRWRSDKVANATVRGFGKISMRCGESDAEVIRQVFANREYEPHPPAFQQRLTQRYEAILASGQKPILVDAGANIGAASIWFSRCYPEARIVAIEPDSANAAMLRRNVSGLPNVTVLEAAIGAEPGFVSLNSDAYSWGIQTERSTSGVRIVTMSEAFDASGGDTPFLVKIDIEGFESDLFASNIDWLDETFAVVIEPHDWLMPGKHTSQSFQKALAAHPFEMIIRGENLFYVR